MDRYVNIDTSLQKEFNKVLARAGGVALSIESLPSKCEALSSSPSTIKKVKTEIDSCNCVL
jgi:hypothetical protein